jgi:hypothetical protein
MDAGVVLGLGGAVIGLLTWVWAVWTRRRDRVTAMLSIDEHEKQLVADLIRWLEGRRVLWYSKTNEIPEETIESVAMIRDRVERDTGAIHVPRAIRAMDAIRSASIDLLDMRRSGFHEVFSREAWRALRDYRKIVQAAARDIATSYGVKRPEWPAYRGGFEDQGVSIYIPGPPD